MPKRVSVKQSQWNPLDRSDPGTYPLSADVVRLVCEHTRHIGIGGRGRKEDAKVSHTDIVHIAEKWQADQAQASVSNDERSTKMQSVAKNSASEHPNSRDHVSMFKSAGCTSDIWFQVGDAYGGAMRHCAAATPKPIPSPRMMGKK